MSFINPIEILELSNHEVDSIDNSLIKKAKRKLFVDIELSDDGLFHYKKQKITKSACEAAIDELNDSDKLEYYHYIANHHFLNNYLAIGDEAFFNSFRRDGKYLNEKFIDFISPYFTKQFDKSIVRAFKANNTNAFILILKTQVLFSQVDFNDAFKSLSIEIKARIQIIDEIKEEIENGNTEYTKNKFEKTYSFVKNNFPIEILNALPQYFQSLINKAAERINYMQLKMGEEYSTKLKILTIIKLLNVDSSDKVTYEDNFKIVEGRLKTQLEEEKHLLVIKEWGKKLSIIKSLIAEANDSISTLSEIKSKIHSISILDLNLLPDFADEIRKQIAISLRNLAVAIYNNYDEIYSSIEVIDKALSIYISTELSDELKETKTELEEIKKRRLAQIIPTKTYPQVKTQSNVSKSDTNGGCVIIIIIAIIIFFSWICSKSNNPSPSYNSTTNNSSLDSTKVDSSKVNTNSQPETNNQIVDTTVKGVDIQPTYTPVTMKNGEISGCTTFEPQSDMFTNNMLTISTDYSTEAAVKLINSETDKCIRYVFLNRLSLYLITDIPEGIYYLKIAYGSDWGVKKGGAKCEGKFTKNQIFKKSNQLLNFNLIHTKKGTKSHSYSLSLGVSNQDTDESSKSDGSFNTNHISEDEFYK
jgi:hypothetical protein